MTVLVGTTVVFVQPVTATKSASEVASVAQSVVVKILRYHRSLQDVIGQAKSLDIYRKLLLSASSTKNLCIPCPAPPKIGLATSIE
jgi:hypothetical protein